MAVSSIAMHIAASFEQNEARRREWCVSVSNVCATGTGTSQLLRARVDLVLTTVPLQLKDVETFRVSPLLEAQVVSSPGSGPSPDIFDSFSAFGGNSARREGRLSYAGDYIYRKAGYPNSVLLWS